MSCLAAIKRSHEASMWFFWVTKEGPQGLKDLKQKNKMKQSLWAPTAKNTLTRSIWSKYTPLTHKSAFFNLAIHLSCTDFPSFFLPVSASVGLNEYRFLNSKTQQRSRIHLWALNGRFQDIFSSLPKIFTLIRYICGSDGVGACRLVDRTISFLCVWFHRLCYQQVK